MRSYIVRQLFGTGAAAVVVLALLWAWPGYNGVTQVDAAANDGTLTVGQCIEVSDSVGPLEEALIREGIIEEDLLQTKVTNSMCKDMLERMIDDSPLRKLSAAQNYIQEIKLIEGAMREAADEASAKGTDWYSSSDESLLFQTISQTSEQVPAAQAQYDGGGGVKPIKQQAAAAAGVGEGDAASITVRLRQKEAAAKNAGASVSEGRAGALCSTEVEVLDDKVKNIEGLYEIIPQMPEEIGLGETKQAGLLVSPVTKKRFQEIRQEHGAIEEVSESDIGCVELADRMKAELLPLDLEKVDISQHHPGDIRELSSNRDTRWGWDITARQTGEVELLLDLRYAISREDQEFRLIPQSPVYDGAIRVTPLQNGCVTEQPWWRCIFEGILGRIFEAFGA